MVIPISAINSQLGPRGRFNGLNKPLLAVVLTVRVALPVSDAGVNAIVLGAVKFWSGAPKLQVGTSTALVGAAVTAQLRVTEPLNPFAPVTVMRHDPGWPGAEMLIVEEVQPDDSLIPGVPTFTVTEAVVVLPM